MAQTTREIPVTTCPACGGSWFEQVICSQFVKEDYEYRIPGLGPRGQINRMPMQLLVCLCGTPFRPELGGVRAGHTPNVEITAFLDSSERAAGRLAERRDVAVIAAAAGRLLVPKGQLGLIRQRIARLQPALGRLFTRKDADGKIRGGVWRTPKRRPASHGRDMLAVQLQKRGLTFDEAHAAVTAIWDAIKEGLKRGESVETPLGLFKIVRRTKPYPRWRLKRWQRMHKNPKRVVFIASPGLLGGR